MPYRYIVSTRTSSRSNTVNKRLKTEPQFEKRQFCKSVLLLTQEQQMAEYRNHGKQKGKPADNMAYKQWTRKRIAQFLAFTRITSWSFASATDLNMAICTVLQ